MSPVLLGTIDFQEDLIPCELWTCPHQGIQITRFLPSDGLKNNCANVRRRSTCREVFCPCFLLSTHIDARTPDSMHA